MCLVAEVEITLKRSERDFLLRALELFTLVVIDGEHKSKYYRIYTKRSECDARLLWFCDLAPVTLHKINTHLYHLANPKALDVVGLTAVER